MNQSGGIIGSIGMLLTVLIGLGLFAITFNDSITSMISGSSVYGTGTDSNLLFVGFGFIVFITSLYVLKVRETNTTGGYQA